MPTGVSPTYYPDQANPRYPVELDNSYFLVRLYEAQAFFEAGMLVRPGYLILSSTVESTFQQGNPMQSLHKISTMQKNVPCRLGIGVNLTDWLPARAGDALHIGLEYAVVQDSPIKDLMDQMGKLGLIAQLTTARPDLKAAIKVSEIVGRLLSFSLKEGGSQEIFKLVLDLNLAGLNAGFYAAVGSQKEEMWPDRLKIQGDEHNASLVTLGKEKLDRCSYAVLQVLALKRRGEEMARGETWWELLQAGKEQALAACPINDQERRKALEDWRSNLARVMPMAVKDKGFLLGEIQEIIRKAQIDVLGILAPQTKAEAFGEDDEIPCAWQDILGVRTEGELYSSVKDYQEALELSKKLIEAYGN
jgi:hypothetical protein